MKLQAILRELMHKHQLTVTTLAERSGMGQPVIHRIVSGELEDPKLSTVRKLAAYFHLTLSQFVGEDPIP